ncbi:MAG: response regulator [Verrucomicrobia bacterium]|nr:response regulator [Verrucomicrobiota bacterium]
MNSLTTLSRIDPRVQPSPAARLSDATANRKRILIADDDTVVRAALAAVLASEGYDVDEAADGRQAVAHATAQPPALVLLDLNMPHVDGWTAFTKLDHVCPLLPVIVITARPHQYKEAVRLGVDAFMEKPLDFPVLLRAIHKLTHEPDKRHTERITDRAFVTRLLNGNHSNHS